MPADNLLETSLESRGVQLAGNAHRGGDIVCGAGWIELTQEPQSLL